MNEVLRSDKATLPLSIIIPTYNKSVYLARLLDSILLQDFDAELYEVIVVNDGSTDNSAQIIQNYQKRFLHYQSLFQENKGIGSARNAGLRKAKGELVAFLADDYVLYPNYCSSLVASFSDPDVIGIRADIGITGDSLIEKMNLNSLRLRFWRNLHNDHPRLHFPPMKLNMPIKVTPFINVIEWSGGAMMRRALFETYGFFYEQLPTGEDGEFAFRLANSGIRMHFYPQVLLKISFRTGVVDNFIRSFEYARDRRILLNKGYIYNEVLSGSQNISFIQRVFVTFCAILFIDTTKWQALRMVPYLVVTRFITLWMRLHE